MAGGITFYGYWYLAGTVVSAWVCGLDCGDYTVAADGTVAVPYGSDPDGLFTSAYAVALAGSGEDFGEAAATVTIGGDPYVIPVWIGYTYTSQGQLLRPDAPQQAQYQTGPTGLAKIRRHHQLGVQLTGTTLGCSFGTAFNTLEPAMFNLETTAGEANITDSATAFDGVYWNTVVDNASFAGQLAWQVTRPYPMTVASITGFMDAEDR